jgi:SAM-dependent methyltransferase
MQSSNAIDLRKLLYPETYFASLSPPDLRLALLSRHIRFGSRQPLRYLELGFGAGFSLNVHAAANDGEFWGNDFVREHVDGASAIAGISGANVRFLLDSFADLLGRTDLPMFDIVAAHGIWTWVSDADRAAIVELLHRKLAPGGIFYVSYNNTAGWSSVVYLRQLMKLYVSETGEKGSAGITNSIAFVRALQSAGVRYFKENPTASAELAMMTGRDPTYLQQEYFLDDWKLMSLAEVEKALRPADLHFGAPFPIIAHDDQLVMGVRGQDILATLQSQTLRETVRECFHGMGFRQDIFVKQAVTLTTSERRDDFRRQSFLLMAQPRNIILRGGSPWGELDLEARGCGPVIEALASGGGAAKSIAALEATLPLIPIDELISRIMLLTGANVVRPTLAPDEQEIAAPRCRALNAHILSTPGEKGAVLASPVLGVGVEVSRLEKIFLIEWLAGRRNLADIAAALERACRSDLAGRSGRDVAVLIERDHLPMFKAMGLAQED